VIVLDTTILVYAVGAEHPLREPCRTIIRAVQAGEVNARTTVEVVQEFAHVRTRRRGRHNASILAHEYAGLLQPLIVLDALDLKRGLELFEHHEPLEAFDAVLAAAVARRGARALVSADETFADVPGLRTLNPGTDLADVLRISARA
jgi:predicted nucleic acid-binding protein